VCAILRNQNEFLRGVHVSLTAQQDELQHLNDFGVHKTLLGTNTQVLSSAHSVMFILALLNGVQTLTHPLFLPFCKCILLPSWIHLCFSINQISTHYIMCWRYADSYISLQYANALKVYYTDRTCEETISMHSASIRLSKGTEGGPAVRTRVSKISAVEDAWNLFHTVNPILIFSQWMFDTSFPLKSTYVMSL